MTCKKCGITLKDDAVSCPACGAVVCEENAASTEKVAEKPKKKHTKKFYIGIIFGALLLLAFIGSGLDEKDNTDDSSSTSVSSVNSNDKNTSSNDEVKQKIFDVLNSTTAVKGYKSKLGPVLTAVFPNYKITYRKWGGETSYNVTISGTYCPNPEVPQYTAQGEVTYLIDIDSGYCKVRNDVYGIEDVIKVYVVNYLG